MKLSNVFQHFYYSKHPVVVCHAFVTRALPKFRPPPPPRLYYIFFDQLFQPSFLLSFFFFFFSNLPFINIGIARSYYIIVALIVRRNRVSAASISEIVFRFNWFTILRIFPPRRWNAQCSNRVLFRENIFIRLTESLKLICCTVVNNTRANPSLSIYTCTYTRALTYPRKSRKWIGIRVCTRKY